MKPQKQFIIMVAVLLMAAACTDSLTKQGYISNYEAWINKLKDVYKEYKKS